MMPNPYEPFPMRIIRTVAETEDQTLKSFELAFDRQADQERFFSLYHPGQFCQLSLFGKGEAPFGVASAAGEGDFVRFTVNRTGVFTRALHALQPGDVIGMRGPLGNWYPIEENKGANLVLIGGGYAFTTIYALAKHLLSTAIRSQYGNLMIIYGARNPDLFLYKREIAAWYGRNDLKFYQTIDFPQEGWHSLTGFVPAVTEKIAPSSENAMACVCGPPVMIKNTLPVLLTLGFPAENIYTSMEKRMKCGIGKCGRCNIGPLYICKDGPVFSLAQLHKLPKDF